MLLWSGMAPQGIAQVLSVDPAPSLERAVQDGFGQAVAVSGDLALVGEGGSLVTEGVVLVYRRDAAGAWTEVQQLTAPDAGRGDGFGQAVALDGDVAVVGAPTRDDGAGKVYVFEVDAASDQFVAVASLQAEQAAPGDAFGSAVAVSGEAVLVGAPQARGTGAAYAFRRTTDGAWTSEGRLHQDGLADGDFFGWSVALDGDWAFVGAQFRQGTGTVEVFRYDGQDTWIADDTLVGSTAEDGARFGFAVALDGDVAVVGAPTQASFSGAAYLLRRDETGDWTERNLLTRSTDGRDLFGNAVAVSDGTAWVGARWRTAFSGVVYSFQRDGDSDRWRQAQELTGSSASNNASFGWSVALDGDAGWIGASGEPLGAAYAFDWSETGWDEQQRVEGGGARAEPITGAPVACVGGTAAGFPCGGVDLLAFMPNDALDTDTGVDANDLWAWVDPATGREYALLGKDDALAFIDVTDPVNPAYLGSLPLPANAVPSTWRDVKVYQNHAYVVADNAGGHGLQVFDLTQLRDVTDPPVTFAATARYEGFRSAHNVAINAETGFAYAVGITGPQGGDGCGAGLHMVDLREPARPAFAGCFNDLQTGGRVAPGYVHDTQCVVYRGPDAEHQGREICISSSERSIGIADVTDKSAPTAIAQATYPNPGYVHQGWLTDDHRYFIQNDELDETGGLVDRTRTVIWDVADLDEPVLLTEYFGPTGSSDHNLYVAGDYVFQANYASGLRVLDIRDIANPVEVAHFDTVPSTDAPGFSGAWSVYPFLPSGTVLVSSSEAGLFVLDLPGVNVATDAPGDVPDGFTLSPAYPNPFNPTTTLTVTLPARQRVTVAAYDALGRRVATLHEGALPAGTHTVTFDASGLPSGTYVLRAEGETGQQARTVTLVK